MNIIVADMLSTNDAIEGLEYYYHHLLQGDEYIQKHSWIVFDELTLRRVADHDSYIVYGRSIPRPQLTLSFTPQQAPRIYGKSAADTDFALMRFMRDPRIVILTIILPAQQDLGKPAPAIEFLRCNGAIHVTAYDAPEEKPAALNG